VIALLRIVPQLNAIARRQPLSRLRHGRPISRHAAVIEQPHDLRPREITHLLHEAINALTDEWGIGGNVGRLSNQRHLLG
jgi:hypothetical protein